MSGPTSHHSHFSWLPWALIVVGVVLMSLWGIHRYFYNQSIALSDALLSTYASEPSSVPTPTHITIGNSISLPIVEAGRLPDGTWAVSNTNANHVRQSANPGERGNIIIYAHNTPNLFGPLDKVKIGDQITVRTTDGISHKYIVASVTWATPEHTELLLPTTIETLTIYTCAGLLDSLRDVVRAVPVY